MYNKEKEIKMFVIVYGNFVDGLSFVGPFINHDSALLYCEGDNTEWHIVELSEPRECSGSVYDLIDELEAIKNPEK
jgi:hypothetical protein